MAQASTPTPSPDRRRLGANLWRDLHRPVRVLVYLLILLTAVLVYREAEFILVRVFAVLLLFVFATIVALLLNPLVDSIEALRPFRGHRALSVMALYVLIAAAVVAVVALVLPELVRQATAFGQTGPRRLADAQVFVDNIQRDSAGVGLKFHVSLAHVADAISGSVLNSAVGLLTGTVSTLINLLLITVISIYLLIQGRELIAALRRIFPSQEQAFDFAIVATGSTIAAYVRGQLAMAGLMGVYTGLVMSLLGVRYAVVLGVAAFFLEFLPLIGAPVAMALAVVLALFQSPGLAVLAGIAGLGGHAIEAYIIGPRISGHATRLHPLAAMAALLIGAELGGVLGALFAVPLAGIVNVYLGALYRHRRGEEAFALPEGSDISLEQLPRLGEEITQAADEAGLVDNLPEQSEALGSKRRSPREAEDRKAARATAASARRRKTRAEGPAEAKAAPRPRARSRRKPAA
jgi:predicted PurR-regulated permease PerM